MNWYSAKILLSFFVSILVPAYWRSYGPQNFLWFSDIGLFLTVLALWTNSTLLMSMAAVGVLSLELIWCLDFFLLSVFGASKIKLADYMFDSTYSLPLRLLSLFHMVLPIIWLFYLGEQGYDKRAIYYTIFLFWVILSLSYFFTDPEKNINWVFFPKIRHTNISSGTWLIIMFIGYPLLVFLPMHYVFLKLFNLVG